MALKDFHDGHEAGRSEIFRQLRDVRATQKAHERRVREDSPTLYDRFALAVTQLQEIDEILATEFNGVYKAGGV